MSDLTLDQYQNEVKRTMLHLKEHKEQMLASAVGLAEEVGEVVGVINKTFVKGKPMNPWDLKEELGDVMWELFALCERAGFDASDVAKANVAKLRARWPEGMK